MEVVSRNLSQYVWARKQRDEILCRADAWLRYDDARLRSLVPPPEVPRAIVAHEKGAPVNGEALNRIGRYSWILSFDKPWQVTSPVDGRTYPSNDFQAFLDSGLKDRSLLTGPYPDDGWGCYVEGEEKPFWFVGVYAHWSVRNLLLPAIDDLSKAYLITADGRYAHACALLLWQLAEYYPRYCYEKQSRYGKEVTPDYKGRLLYHTWESNNTCRVVPPARNVLPEKIGLPAAPGTWEPITGVREWPTGLELWRLMRQELGEHGVLGMPSGATTCILSGPEDVYGYADNPARFTQRRDAMIARVTERMETLSNLDEQPDFLLCGGSGSLVWQSPSTFRELALPVLRHVTELACELGIPTHVHSCGPEKELVRFAAEETQLTVIDPLEIPPMGDCDLAELKRLYGDKIVLKGNLHTTSIMLRGSVEDVVAASRRAIDDAAAGGRFVLSTGDQCGRDTPDENIRAMVETARTYGKY